MSSKRRPSVDDLYDRRYNAPESGVLSAAENETIEAGRLALSSLHKTLDLWVAVARAVKTLRDRAVRIGGRQIFRRLMAQNGFSMDGGPHEKVLDKGVVSKLLAILERLPEVMAWYEGLTPKQKREWAAPTTVFKHCPIFQKPASDRQRPKPVVRKVNGAKDPYEARDIYTEWLKDVPKDTRAVEVAKFMADVGIKPQELMKAREFLGYRDRQ